MALAVGLLGCGPEWVNTDGKDQDNSDIADALARLGDATVLHYTNDGVPTYIVGDMAHVGDGQIDNLAQAEAAIRPALTPVLAAFRMTSDELVLRKINVDELGLRAYRFDMKVDGMDVIGGDMVVGVDIKGAISGISGAGRGDLPRDGSDDISASSAVNKVAQDSRFSQLATATPRKVYIITAESKRYRAYEVMVEGYRGDDPARDAVYVDAQSGEIVAVHPKIHYAKNRRVYTANNGTSIPGTLVRSEGGAASSDIDINAAYDNTGLAYDLYNTMFARDSYNNAGAQLTSSVHYSSNYCNAFWNGSQMVYGDGSGSTCLPLARSVDVTAHELTHAVTEYESNLTYSGESGGINEAMSDIFGAVVESWNDAGHSGNNFSVSADTWKVGEDILPPYLRLMSDPAADGASLDFWTSGAGSVDVHYSSGIANLAFYLLSQGGTHPRGKSTTNVTGIGIEKAARIFYKSNADKLSSSSNYAALRTAAVSSATDLGYDAATITSVHCAFFAVGVGTTTGCSGTEPPPPTDTVLTSGTSLGGQSGALNAWKYYTIAVPTGATNLTVAISGGTGDADLYVIAGTTHPTESSYTCRPYLSGNNETCSITNPTAGTYAIGVKGYSAYSGMSIVATVTTGGGGGGDPYLSNGTAVTGLSGATGSFAFWRVAVPASKQVIVRISGGTGDADLYTRFGSRPTTSTYLCRPYTSGNSESCTRAAGTAGDLYVGIRGYAAYSGVQVIATW